MHLPMRPTEPTEPPPGRLPSGTAPALLRHGELTIDPVAFAARYRGKVIPLRPNDFRLLAHFVANPDRVFDRQSLIECLGKDSGVMDERTVDVWTGRLRRALRAHSVPDPIRTVRSYGYVLDSIQE